MCWSHDTGPYAANSHHGCGGVLWCQSPNRIEHIVRASPSGYRFLKVYRRWVLKLGSLAWRLAPLIVVFSCRDDITAPVYRPLASQGPRVADAIPGLSPQVGTGGYHT